MAWIVAYKIVKVFLALGGGIAALRLRHHNLVEVAQGWLSHLGFDPEGKMAAGLLARIANIDPANLRWLALVCFVYALLYLIEGVGLYFEKRWAEWFTVFQTSLIVPVEIYGLIARQEMFKWLALITSVLVIGYLLWRLRRERLEGRSQEPPIVKLAE